MMERYRQIGNLFESQLSQEFLMQPYLACFCRQSQLNFNTTQPYNSFQQVHDNCYKSGQKTNSNISWSVSKLSHSQYPSLIKSSSLQHMDTYTNPNNNPNAQILFSSVQNLQYISQQHMQYHLIQRLSSLCQHKIESIMAQFNGIRNQLVFAIQKEKEKFQYCRMIKFLYGSEGKSGIVERSDRSVVNINYHNYGLRNQIQALIAQILQHLGYIRPHQPPQLQKHHHSQQINSSNLPRSAQISINLQKIPREYNNRISQLIRQAKNNYYSHVQNNQLESQQLQNHFNVFDQGQIKQYQSYCGQNGVVGEVNQRKMLENGGQGDGDDGEFRYIYKIIEQNNNRGHKSRQIVTNNNQTQQQKLSLTYSKFSNKSSINQPAGQKNESQSTHSRVFNYNNNKNCNNNKESHKFEDMELHLSISQSDFNSTSKSNYQQLSNQETILYDNTVLGHCRQLVEGNVRDEYVVGLKQNKFGLNNGQYLYGLAPLNQISITQNTPRNTYNYLKYRRKLKRNLQKQFNDLGKNRVGSNKNRVDKDGRQNKIKIKEGLKEQNLKYQYFNQQITIYKPNTNKNKYRNEANRQSSTKNKNKQNLEIESISILNVRIDDRNQVKIANQRQSKWQAKTKTKTKIRQQKCKQINRGYPFGALIHHRVHY